MSRSIRLVLALFWAATVFASSSAATPRWLVSAPESIISGETARIELVALNPTDHELTANFIPQLDGRLIFPSRETLLVLSLVAGQGPSAVRLAPHAAETRSYDVQFASAQSGAAQLQIDLPGVTPVPVTVQKPAEPAATKSTSGPDFNHMLKHSEAGAALLAFREHFGPYEPIYFVGGGGTPTSKFQYSFKYSLFNPNGRWVANHEWLRGPHFAFTQTSLWDLGGADSSPFFDSSYKPELFYLWENAVLEEWKNQSSTNRLQLDLQAGARHESNGKSGADSRSINIVYFQPTLTLVRNSNLLLTFSPRAWAYIVDVDDNPDIARYRGYVGARAAFGWVQGVQLAAETRAGNDFGHGALQLDLTYPLSYSTKGNVNLYLQVQYFTGWGESILHYRERQQQIRFGLGLYR
jgi:phospholipase A1